MIVEGHFWERFWESVNFNQKEVFRECVHRKFLTKPMTVKLLDESGQYGLRRGVTDWGLVINVK